MADYKLTQRTFRELRQPQFYPKGTVVKYITRQGVEAEYTNAAPSNRANRRNMLRVRPAKQSPTVLVGTNHERHLARSKAREAQNG